MTVAMTVTTELNGCDCDYRCDCGRDCENTSPMAVTACAYDFDCEYTYGFDYYSYSIAVTMATKAEFTSGCM